MNAAGRRCRGVVAGLASLLLLPGVAHAHLVGERFGAFYAGVLHPLTALENLLPWLALGLLAGLQPARTARWVLPVFPASLAVGVGLAIGGLAPLDVPWLTPASFVMVGALVVVGRPLPPAVLLAVAAAQGFLHGHDNGLALPAGGDALLFAGGVAACGYVVVTLGAAAASMLVAGRRWGAVAVRALGSWITAVGLMVTALGVVQAG